MYVWIGGAVGVCVCVCCYVASSYFSVVFFKYTHYTYSILSFVRLDVYTVHRMRFFLERIFHTSNFSLHLFSCFVCSPIFIAQYLFKALFGWDGTKTSLFPLSRYDGEYVVFSSIFHLFIRSFFFTFFSLQSISLSRLLVVKIFFPLLLVFSHFHANISIITFHYCSFAFNFIWFISFYSYFLLLLLIFTFDISFSLNFRNFSFETRKVVQFFGEINFQLNKWQWIYHIWGTARST